MTKVKFTTPGSTPTDQQYLGHAGNAGGGGGGGSGPGGKVPSPPYLLASLYANDPQMYIKESETWLERAMQKRLYDGDFDLIKDEFINESVGIARKTKGNEADIVKTEEMLETQRNLAKRLKSKKIDTIDLIIADLEEVLMGSERKQQEVALQKLVDMEPVGQAANIVSYIGDLDDLKGELAKVGIPLNDQAFGGIVNFFCKLSIDEKKQQDTVLQSAHDNQMTWAILQKVWKGSFQNATGVAGSTFVNATSVAGKHKNKVEHFCNYCESRGYDKKPGYVKHKQHVCPELRRAKDKGTKETSFCNYCSKTLKLTGDKCKHKESNCKYKTGEWTYKKKD